MLRTLLTVALAPDVIDENDPAQKGTLPQLRTLQEHSLTRGSNFGAVVDPLLLTFSPGAFGYVFNWMPHALIFLSGINGSLTRDYPQTPSTLYLPNIQAFGSFAWKDAEWYEDIEPANGEALLQWWVTRLNVVYSYLLDPTNFEEVGRHDAPRQVATLLTFERLLADLLLVQAGFQGSELARQQAAFDLLDKPRLCSASARAAPVKASSAYSGGRRWLPASARSGSGCPFSCRRGSASTPAPSTTACTSMSASTPTRTARLPARSRSGHPGVHSMGCRSRATCRSSCVPFATPRTASSRS
jgi:hypothetical protein